MSKSIGQIIFAPKIPFTVVVPLIVTCFSGFKYVSIYELGFIMYVNALPGKMPVKTVFSEYFAHAKIIGIVELLGLFFVS